MTAPRDVRVGMEWRLRITNAGLLVVAAVGDDDSAWSAPSGDPESFGVRACARADWPPLDGVLSRPAS